MHGLTFFFNSLQNDSLGAFALGNLRHRDLAGRELPSQLEMHREDEEDMEEEEEVPQEPSSGNVEEDNQEEEEEEEQEEEMEL